MSSSEKELSFTSQYKHAHECTDAEAHGGRESREEGGGEGGRRGGSSGANTQRGEDEYVSC